MWPGISPAGRQAGSKAASFSMRTALLFALCLLGHSSPLIAGAPRKILPVDEAERDPAFFLFRARLMEAVAAHDAKELAGFLSPKIMIGVGGESGIADFMKQWRPEEKNSKLWSELGRVLALGGKFSRDGGFSAPYFYAAWPESDDVDPFEWVAVVGDNVRVREKPHVQSPVVGRVSFELVRVAEQQDGASDEWTKVNLADGKQGFIASRFVGSSIGYRAVFQREDGKWRLSAFLAGD